jgi:hypothetical protein
MQGEYTHDGAQFARCKPFIAAFVGEKRGKRLKTFRQHFTFYGTNALGRVAQWIAVDGAQMEWLRYGPKNDAGRNQFRVIGSRSR